MAQLVDVDYLHAHVAVTTASYDLVHPGFVWNVRRFALVVGKLLLLILLLVCLCCVAGLTWLRDEWRVLGLEGLLAIVVVIFFIFIIILYLYRIIVLQI